MYIFYNKIIFCCKRCLSSVENIQSCRKKRKVLQKEFTLTIPKQTLGYATKNRAFGALGKSILPL